MREPDGERSHGEAPVTYVACVPKHGRKRTFFTEESTLGYYDAATSIDTAGHYIALAFDEADHYNQGASGLFLYDAASGATVFSRAWPRSAEEPLTAPAVRAGLVAASSRGELAWVRETVHFTMAEGTFHSKVEETVDLWDGHQARDLETASAITGLRFDGRELRWLAAGTPHSAPVRVVP